MPTEKLAERVPLLSVQGGRLKIALFDGVTYRLIDPNIGEPYATEIANAFMMEQLVQYGLGYKDGLDGRK